MAIPTSQPLSQDLDSVAVSTSKAGIRLRAKSGAMKMAVSGQALENRPRKDQGIHGMMGGAVRTGSAGEEGRWPREPGLVLSCGLVHQVHRHMYLCPVWAQGLCVCLRATEGPLCIIPLFPPLWPQLL